MNHVQRDILHLDSIPEDVPAHRDVDLLTNRPLPPPRKSWAAIPCDLVATCPRTLGPSLSLSSRGLKPALREALPWLVRYSTERSNRRMAAAADSPADPVDEDALALSQEIDRVITELRRLTTTKRKLPPLPLVWQLGDARISIRARKPSR